MTYSTTIFTLPNTKVDILFDAYINSAYFDAFKSKLLESEYDEEQLHIYWSLFEKVYRHGLFKCRERMKEMYLKEKGI